MAWGGGNANSVEAWVKRLKENDTTFTSLHILSFRRISTTELGQVFEALAENTTLKELYASGHGLDVAAVTQLSKSLETNTTLERLNIGHDRLGSDEEVMMILAEGLAHNRGLVRLDLENKGLGGHEGSVRALAKALSSYSSSSIQQESSSTTARTLVELNLARNKLNDQDVTLLSEALSSHESLQKLDLCLNSFGEEGTRAVAKYLTSDHQKLLEIDLSDNEMTEAGGKAIGEALAKNKTLERLRMSSVMDPPLPVEEGQEDFIPFDSTLEELNKDLSEEQVSTLRTDGDVVLEKIAASLRSSNSTLQELWMDYCNISPVGALALANALRENRGLVTIRMRNNSVGNRGARALGVALTPKIHSGNTDASSSFSSSFNTTLRSLELGENKIGVLGWYGLVGASSLESLGLYANKIHVLHEALESHQANILASSMSSPVSPIPSSVVGGAADAAAATLDHQEIDSVDKEAAPALSANMANGASYARQVFEHLVHLDVGCNGISREHFTQLGVCLIKGLLPALIKLEIAGNGDRTESGGGDNGELPEQDQEEQHAWDRVATRIEEARPDLTIHWKGGQGRE
ncbi:hypothetical protein BGZ94_002389 [Podila epigama]|nr:hypothetical protein BGZ94_002389 [Podila epigama]